MKEKTHNMEQPKPVQNIEWDSFLDQLESDAKRQGMTGLDAIRTITREVLGGRFDIPTERLVDVRTKATGAGKSFDASKVIEAFRG